MSGRSKKLVELARKRGEVLNDENELNKWIESDDDSDCDPTYDPNSENMKRGFRIVDFNFEGPSAALDDVTNQHENEFIRQDDGNSTPLHRTDFQDKPGPSVAGNCPIKTRGIKNESRKIRRERTKRRNAGLSYSTRSGKRRSERTMLPLPKCRRQCRVKIIDEKRLTLFKEYWKLNSYNKRAAYIGSLVEVVDKATSRPRTEDPNRQKYRLTTNRYFLEIDGTRTQTCKTCFLNTFGETDNFVNLVCRKKRSTLCGFISDDGRGRAPPPSKFSKETMDNVRKHLLSFPTHDSHYTRRENDRKYLPSHFTMKMMYDLYRNEYSRGVSYRYYSQEFHALKLAIKPRKLDTCDECDKFKLKLDLATDDVAKRELTIERDYHLFLADETYKQKAKDKQVAKENENIQCLTLDLQQCLATPFLSNAIAFYKRQLWTYNLTIHDNKTNQAFCYMWHEAIAVRGANEIASCIFKHIQNLPDGTTKVILYSDTCGGQKKNSYVAAMLTLALQKCPGICTIEHKFMLSGHSHMEVDGDHAVIERKKQKCSTLIGHPHDWYQLVRSCGPRFSVIEMTQDDFLEFSNMLKGPLVKRNKDVAQNDFRWQPVRTLKYSKRFIFIQFKTSLDDYEPYQEVSFLRQKISEKWLADGGIVPKIRSTLLPISKEKKADLLSLLEFIPPVFHNFYRSLPSSDSTVWTDPDLDEIDADNHN